MYDLISTNTNNGIHPKQKHVRKLLFGAAHDRPIVQVLGIPERRIGRGIQSRHSVRGHHAELGSFSMMPCIRLASIEK